jgi:hypothetical protein
MNHLTPVLPDGGKAPPHAVCSQFLFLPLIFFCLFTACGNSAGGEGGDNRPAAGLAVNAENLDTLVNLLTTAGGRPLAESPLPLVVDVSLNSANWNALLTALDSAGKYVSLDLSTCAMPSGNTEFDPGAGAIGVDKIVSLVLPNGAASVKAGAGWDSSISRCDSTFTHFTALTSVSGTGITAVDEYAFSGCTVLTTVSLPAAAGIGDYAFEGCTALEMVNLPAMTSINMEAFKNCTALTTVSLPAAAGIGNSAFSGCSALETVSLPAATDIDDDAFWGCTALETVSLPAATSIGALAFSSTGTTALTLTLTLGSRAPALWKDMFCFVDSPKTVTVKVPSAALSAYAPSPTDTTAGNWANAFRGMGWSSTGGYGTGTVNTNITLDIQYITP